VRGLVFATSVGTPIRNLRRSWAQVKGLTGLNMRFHDVRHADVTLLLCQDVHPKAVAERLGHSRLELTLNTYSHVLPGLQAEAVAKLDAVLVSNSLAIANGGEPNEAAR
jgi:integrase